MKKLTLIIATTILSSAMLFTACKKRKAFKNEDGEASSDSRNVITENEAAVNDINTEVGNNLKLHGRSSSGASSLQSALGISATGYMVDTTGAYLGTIKINYDGTVINNRKREGSIRLTILDYAAGKRWKQVGCVLKVEYLGFKITRSSDNKSVELNGIQNLTNITGGTWWELLILKTQTSLASSVTGSDLNVKFDDGKTAVYNINRKFTYTLPNGILTCTGEGIGSSESLSNLENFGTTRDGDKFTSQVTTPVIWNWTCGWHAPTQGALEVKVDSKDFTLNVTFSVDQSGNTVSPAANSCSYGWKVEWKHKNKTNKKVIKYS